MEEIVIEPREDTTGMKCIGKEVTEIRWGNLMNYLKDGSLEIGNNLAENAIRPIALGRKNYQFAWLSRGAERAAMFYSFFGTHKKWREPFRLTEKSAGGHPRTQG